MTAAIPSPSIGPAVAAWHAHKTADNAELLRLAYIGFCVSEGDPAEARRAYDADDEIAARVRTQRARP